MSKCFRTGPLLKHACVSRQGPGAVDCIPMATAEVVLVDGHLTDLAPKGS